MTSLVVTPLDVVKVRVQARSMEGSRLPKNVEPCPKGCGTFVLNNGQMDVVLPKSAVSFFDQSGRLTAEAKELFCSSRGNGTLAMLRKIFHKEGVSGLYAGLRPTLVMAVPNTVLYFSAYDELSYRLQQESTGDYWIPLLAGGAARFLASAVTAPLEYMRTREASRVGSNLPKLGLMGEIRSILKEEGVGSFYKGFGSTLWRDVPFSAIYWLSIERMRLMWKNNDEAVSASTQFFQAFVNGAVSGSIAAACTTPFDVVKTRQQQVAQTEAAVGVKVACCAHDGAVAYDVPSHRSASTFTYLRHIAATEGVMGLWRGNWARMIKVAPACAIMISSYELGKRVLEP